jgi:hypothetical protein
MPAPKQQKKEKRSYTLLMLVGVVGVVLVVFVLLPEALAGRYDRAEAQATSTVKSLLSPKPAVATLDIKDYDRRMLALANYPASASTTATTTRRWPPATVHPKAGALLPFNRIVAYYGNFYSTGMGVLGQYPPDIMLQKLQAQTQVWKEADPSTPVIPAIDYIVTTAQGTAQSDGTYRLRMPASQIQKAIDLANQVHGIVFLDVQVGLSDLPRELPRLAPYLALPNVHLAIDPEFAMHNGIAPGHVIGTMSSADVNYAINFLDTIATQNNLPPKILVVHRFTEDMVTGYRNIKPTENVQVVMDMDGWGFGAKKLNTYQRVITQEPVQFAGFKLFYKNDLKPPSTRMLTPAEVLSQQPAPSYIQYQ